MPPKPVAVRKPALANDGPALKDGKGTTSSKVNAAASMPPPPAPSKPPGILEPELDAMGGCLRNAAIQTGLIYKFSYDAARLQVAEHVPSPPRSLTEQLTGELSRYDQYCDIMEAQLRRAIAVLQRDLYREELRLRLEAEKAAALELEAKRRAEALKDIVMTPPRTTIDERADAARKSTTSSPAGPSLVPLSRRQSKVSLSTLQRNPFPLKLDLSSMRMSEDAGIGLGMGTGLIGPPTGMSIPGLSRLDSPVQITSGRALGSADLDPNLFAQFPGQMDMMDAGQQVPQQHMGAIDLTMGDEGHDMNGSSFMPIDVDSALGNSADKPIELDLDIDSTMNDIFGGPERDGNEQTGDSTGMNIDTEDVNVEALFSSNRQSTSNLNLPATSTNASESATGDGMDISILNALSQGGDFGDAELMATLGAGDSSGSLAAPKEGGAGSAVSTPSPNTIIAGLAGTANNTPTPSQVAKGKMPATADTNTATNPTDQSNATASASAQAFDYSQLGNLDMSNFNHLFPGGESDGMGMEVFGQFLGIGQGASSGAGDSGGADVSGIRSGSGQGAGAGDAGKPPAASSSS